MAKHRRLGNIWNTLDRVMVKSMKGESHASIKKDLRRDCSSGKETAERVT